MAKTDQFSFSLMKRNNPKLKLLSRGAQLSASAWLNGKIAEAWRTAFGEASPEDVEGLFPSGGGRITLANGSRRKVAA